MLSQNFVIAQLTSEPANLLSIMNLVQHVEKFFATATSADLDELLRKANFDHYNKVGVDILSPVQAAQRADVLANTFSAQLLLDHVSAIDRAWTWATGTTPVSFGPDINWVAQGSVSSVSCNRPEMAFGSVKAILATPCDAGNTEVMPLAA